MGMLRTTSGGGERQQEWLHDRLIHSQNSWNELREERRDTRRGVGQVKEGKREEEEREQTVRGGGGGGAKGGGGGGGGSKRESLP